MRIELRELSIRDGNDIFEMLKEIGPGEDGFANEGFSPEAGMFASFLYDSINESRGIDLLPGRVPQTKYWLIVDGYPVGYSKLRLYLNTHLRETGGHIAYCIRPSARGRGYGKTLLAELLKKAKEKNIPRALVTCDDFNIASRKVAEGNGGKLERVENGECYYWFPLDERNGVREIHPDDYGELMELWTNTPGMGINEADSEENIAKFLLYNKGLSYCRRDDGKIIGTVLCGHDARRGYIYHTAVLPEYRGRGIGHELVEKSLQKLKEEGIHKCHLFVLADNELGKRFWSFTGWVKREDILIYSKNG